MKTGERTMDGTFFVGEQKYYISFSYYPIGGTGGWFSKSRLRGSFVGLGSSSGDVKLENDKKALIWLRKMLAKKLNCAKDEIVFNCDFVDAVY